MKVSQNLLDFLGREEGRKLIAYPDPKTGGAPWTIGEGHTGPDVYPGLVITQQQSDDLLRSDMLAVEAMVNGAVTVNLTQAQFDMVCSIVENVGCGSKHKDGIIHLRNGRPSTLLRKLNAGDYQGTADEFPKWCSPGSNVEHGLTERRKKEREIFLHGWDDLK